MSHVLLTGNFNHPEIDWKEEVSPGGINHKASLFLEANRDAFLFQHMKEPAYLRSDQTPNRFDLILTVEKDMVSGVQHLPPLGKSHHQIFKFTYRCYSKDYQIILQDTPTQKGTMPNSDRNALGNTISLMR